MNKILLSGRIVRDAELKLINNFSKSNFTIAVERAYQKDKHNKKSDFINCDILGKGAERLNQYLTKGKAIVIEGELNIDIYEKEKEKKSYTKVKVDRIEFQQGNKDKNTGNKDNEYFSPVDDDDIPF